MTWLANWNYRKAITVSHSGSPLTDYQILITIDTASLITATKMRSDCGDIRLTGTDGTTLLSYWIESGCNTVLTRIWVKIPSILTGNNTIYLYYGNSGASTLSSGTNTFIEFLSFESGLESFNGGSRNTVQAYDGSYSFQGAVDAYARRANLVVTRPYVREYSYYVPSGQSGSISTIAHSSPTNNRGTSLIFGYPTSEKWGYVNNVPAWADSGIGITYNIWHTLKVIVGVSSTDSYTDNTLIFTGTTLTNDPPYAGNDNIYLYSGKTFYIDAIRTRKYVSPEPTICVGGEEVSTVSRLTNWNRRKLLTITGSTSGVQTDYQMKLTVHKSIGTDTSTDIYAGTNINNDFSDLRFTTNDGSTLLNYWIESYTSGSVAIVWIKIPSIPISPCTTTIYLYYSNSGASTSSNGTQTFLAFADFNSDEGFTIVDNGVTKSYGDSTGRIRTNNGRIDFVNIPMDSSLNYIYKDYGSSYFEDVILEYNGMITGHGTASIALTGFANQVGLSPNGVYAFSADYVNDMGIYSWSSGTLNYTTPYIQTQENVNFYVKLDVKKYSGNSTISVYSDPQHTSLFTGAWSNPTTLTSPSTGFRYFYPLSSYNAGVNTRSITGWLDNFRVRKYASPEPTFSSIGTEEVLSPANITATNMTITPSETPCRQGICIATVDVTWTNTGGISGSFTPSLKIDTIPVVVSPPLTPVSVGPLGTASQQFIISGMTTGTHNICPDPN